jgi:hypothetical protein
MRGIAAFACAPVALDKCESSGISDMMGMFVPDASLASSGVASRIETRDLPLAAEYSITEGTALYSLFGPKSVGARTS